MAPIPKLGVRLARRTFAPDLLETDGVAHLVDTEGKRIGWMPYEHVFDIVWNGTRHVMMGASQIDQHGNQNISAIGPYDKPKVQLLGVRGAPGNTACHTTSYWVGKHNARVFVPAVDVVSGIGTDHGAKRLGGVVTNLGVFDFDGPNGQMRVVSLHPGIDLATAQEATGFALHAPDNIPQTPSPTDEAMSLLDALDPDRRVRDAVR
jgi:acyl CoA:acetate/3-ketoacid CoA transferase beta subunit